MKIASFVLLTILSAACLVSAQTISVGVKGGVPLDETYKNIGHDESRPFVIGPSFEVSLPAHFAIEVDALYQRIGRTLSYNASAGIVITGPFYNSSITRERGNSWEFPILGKYYVRPRMFRMQPFLAAGADFRTIGRSFTGSQTFTSAAGVTATTPFSNQFRAVDSGLTAAAGLKYKWGRAAISPEVRYTYWANPGNTTSRNEARLLLGISF